MTELVASFDIIAIPLHVVLLHEKDPGGKERRIRSQLCV